MLVKNIETLVEGKVVRITGASYGRSEPGSDLYGLSSMVMRIGGQKLVFEAGLDKYGNPEISVRVRNDKEGTEERVYFTPLSE
jgi:hypothetical protein